MEKPTYEFILNHVITCLRKAENNESNVTEDILKYKGMSGYKTRHFYNNICSLPNCRYLEIGTYHGSSSISAIYKNQVDALFIDNWSLFDGDKNIFYRAIEKFNTGSKVQVIDNDCWKINDDEIDQKFNVYLYDGGHDYDDHYKAISLYHSKLEDNCIVLIDDWNWESVRKGTFDAFADLKIDVKFKYEIFTPEPHYELGITNWWNGIGIFII
jgi:hypothetical protein